MALVIQLGQALIDLCAKNTMHAKRKPKLIEDGTISAFRQ
jgi:hypothetical protein